MSIYRLRRRVKALGRAVLALGAIVVVLGALMLVNRANEVERGAIEEAESICLYVQDGGPCVIMEHGHPTAEPTPEPVSDALAVATIADYANLEASRIVKMASVLMDLGGTYTATCSAIHYMPGDRTETKYRLTWQRDPASEDDPGIKEQWEGANWSECIAKMLVWKGGE